MSAPVRPAWRNVRDEWRANPRLRWGAAVVALILFVYACLVLVDWRRQLHDEYQARTTHLYKMTALAREAHWIERARSARALEKALQAEVPTAATIGLAQAEVQTFARQLASAYGRRLVSDTRAPAQVPGHPGVWRVPVVVRGTASQTQMLEILRRVEGSDRLMVVDEFSYTGAQEAPTFAITISALYRLGGASGEPADAG